MTFAWYGHLKHKTAPLLLVIVISWGIVFFEYCFQVPANRIGHGTFTGAQLKTIQEVITMIVFCVFSVFYLKEDLKWNYLVGFALIAAAVFFIRLRRRPWACPCGSILKKIIAVLSSQASQFTFGWNIWYYFNWDRHRFF